MFKKLNDTQVDEIYNKLFKIAQLPLIFNLDWLKKISNEFEFEKQPKPDIYEDIDNVTNNNILYYDIFQVKICLDYEFIGIK